MKQSATIVLLLKRVDCNDGVASYLETLVTGLRGAGDRVIIVSGSVTTLYGSEQRQRVITEAVDEWLILDGLRPALPSPFHIRAILGVIHRHGVDIVSPQGFSVLPLGVVIARLTHRRVVANFHLLPSVRPALLPLTHRIYRAVTFVFRSDRYIAMSSEILSFFRDVCHIPQWRIHTQMLGIDTAFYRAPSEKERRDARVRFQLDESVLVAILPARMNATKGHDVAVAAFRLLRARRPASRMICLFAGAGDEREAIEADALRDDADRATFLFLGFVGRTLLREAYWASDIVLLPSRIEGFGLVVAEAMCCGAIVIRTPSGGWQDQVIEGKTGFLVPFNDPPALAAAIEKVLDAPSRSTLRSAAMEYAAASFSKEEMIQGTSRLYREVATLGEHGGRISGAA